MKASDISMDGGYSTLTWITRFINKWCFHLHQTLTVFVTLVSVKPLSAVQVSSPAISLVTAARLSLSVSPVLVTSAMSGSTSQDRSGGGLPAIISQWNIFSLSRKGFYTKFLAQFTRIIVLLYVGSALVDRQFRQKEFTFHNWGGEKMEIIVCMYSRVYRTINLTAA